MMKANLVKGAFLISALIGLVLFCNGALTAQRSRKPAQRIEKAGKGKLASEKIAEKPELVVQNGHADTVRFVAFSPDGEIIASGSSDKTIRLWNTEDGKLIRVMEGHVDGVTSLAFSPDGKKLVSGSLDKTVKVWDPATGRQIRTFTDHDREVNSVAFSPDGKLIASASEDKTVNLLDTGGALIDTIENASGAIRSLAFSPDGQTIAGGCEDKSIRIWSVRDGSLIRTLEGLSSEARSLAFSSDGKSLVSATMEKSVKVWDVSTGKLAHTLKGHSGSVTSVALSSDGKVIASGSQDKSVKLWDARTGNLIRTVEGSGSPVTSVAFSNDGATIASASLRSVWLWRADDGNLIRSLDGYSHEVRSVAFSPDGKTVASTSSKSIKLWDAGKPRLLQSWEGHASEVSSFAFSPDGKLLASGSWDKTIRLWDTGSGKLIRTLEKHALPIGSIAFSPDGKTIATGSEDRTIKVWNAITGKLTSTLEGHHSLIASLAFSFDGKTIASGSADETARLWDVGTGTSIRVFKGHASQVNSVALSPDGKTLVSGSSDKTIKFWSTESGAMTRSVDASSYDVLCVAFSPDGTMIASGGFDKAIRIWDASGGKLVRILNGHSSPVVSVAFSPDQKTIASGSRDTTMKLWSLETGRPMISCIAFKDGNWIAFTPEGYYDGSDRSGLYVAWRVGKNVYSFDQLFDRFFNPEVITQSLENKNVNPARSVAQGFAPAPQVRIVFPRRNETFTSPEVEVAIESKDLGGGVSDIRLYQNDKLVDPGRRAIKVALRDTTTSYRVLLNEGENSFKVVAFSDDRTESKPYEVKVNLAAPEQKSDLYLLVVGINRYKNSALNLNFAMKDAAGIADYFQDKGHRLFRDIKVTRLYDEEANRADILAAFQALITKSQPRDVVVIYFAGHGDSRGSQWYFVPYEIVRPEKDEALTVQGISSSMIYDFVVKIRSQKVVLLLDACRSGKLTTVFRGIEERKTLDQLARAAGIHIIAASTADQDAAEVSELGHGMFTYLLLKGLKGEATLTAGKNSVTVRSLLSYVEDQMPEISRKYRAEAQYAVSNSRGMDFPLAVVN